MIRYNISRVVIAKDKKPSGIITEKGGIYHTANRQVHTFRIIVTARGCVFVLHLALMD
jgi:hypothetical protein